MQLKKIIPLLAVGVLASAAASAQADTFYSASTVTAYSTFFGGTNGLQGKGDDYDTGVPSFLLTGMSFTGGTFNFGDSLTIHFYDTSFNLVGTVSPSAAEVFGSTSVKTLAPADFGSGITLPGAGYFIFAPVGSVPMSLGYGDIAPAPGTSLFSNAKTDDTGTFTIGNNVFGFGPVPYAAVTLTGTPLPEPASLALLTPAALMLLKRRQRKA